MKKTLLTILGLIFYSSIVAQTQSEMNQSEANKLNLADKELNSVYNQIISDYKDNPVFISKLREAQLQWIKFRDAEVEMKFPEPDKSYYGTMYPMCRAGYLTLLTKERTKKLKEWLKPRPEGEGCAGSIKERETAVDNLPIEKIEEYDLNRFINEFEILKEFDSSDLRVRILQLSNGAGSAGNATGEVTHDLYIAVSEPGEIFIGNLYRIRNLYGIVIERIDKSVQNQGLIEFSYGAYNKREKATLIATIKDLKKASS